LRNHPDIRKALKICEEGAFTDAELYAYEKYWDAVRVERTLLADGKTKGVEEGIAKGIAKGRAEGIAEGMAKGIAKGMAKGMTEGMAKGIAEGITKGREESFIDIVRSSTQSGLSVEQLQVITKFSEEKILEILRSKP
jgi:flagellar biosynthesis/type III secretory pathway protein FliH